MINDYIYGLMLADGNLLLYSQNRGKLTIEVAIRDKDIIYKLNEILPGGSISKRLRSTNFKSNYESICYKNYLLEVRNALLQRGFPVGQKSKVARPPIDSYSDKDFWRGFIDGDGSIGFINNDIPYLSLGTISENIYLEFTSFLKNKFGIVKHLKRNKRDNCYNIIIKNEEAIEVAAYLYSDAEIYLDRKYNEYLKIKSWVRTTRKLRQVSWTEEEVDYIINHDITESARYLGRTEQSIKMKLYR